MPCASHSLRSARTNSAGAGLKPPSPCTGSKMIAATRFGSMSALNSVSTAAIESALVTPCNAFGYGAWNTSPGNGPKPILYGATLPVSAMPIIVRPWKPPANAITPGRPV
ncbi:hypothetical protein BBK_5486 [Burkholderia pseudomallei NCTC 13179]|nr:hypothetical protein BBK_5486 [Burkholderia pseudomallei NCTC 13179]